MSTTTESPLDFDPETLPWIDRPDADVERYLADNTVAEKGYDVREKLVQWKEQGFVIFEQAVSHALIDAYLADVHEFMDRHREFSTMISCHKYGTAKAKEYTREQLDEPQLRICDLHNNAISGKKLALNPRLVSFLRHVFRDDVVMMQSLTFLRSSEQAVHQDYAYVVSKIPSHLAACWIALEDVQPDAGPLFYYPGSHRIPKFDFGNGLFHNAKSTRHPAEFAEYIHARCKELGLKQETFLPKKGDMLIWHAALAHSGLEVRNRTLTRRSYVCHFSSRNAYPVDRRKNNVPPTPYEYNSGIVYGHPIYPQEEDLLKRGADPSLV